MLPQSYKGLAFFVAYTPSLPFLAEFRVALNRRVSFLLDNSFGKRSAYIEEWQA
jgi:hypothetical protein